MSVPQYLVVRAGQWAERQASITAGIGTDDEFIAGVAVTSSAGPYMVLIFRRRALITEKVVEGARQGTLVAV